MAPRTMRGNHLPEVLSEYKARALVPEMNPRPVTGLRNRVALVLMLRAGEGRARGQLGKLEGLLAAGGAHACERRPPETDAVGRERQDAVEGAVGRV